MGNAAALGHVAPDDLRGGIVATLHSRVELSESKCRKGRIVSVESTAKEGHILSDTYHNDTLCPCPECKAWRMFSMLCNEIKCGSVRACMNGPRPPRPAPCRNPPCGKSIASP